MPTMAFTNFLRMTAPVQFLCDHTIDHSCSLLQPPFFLPALSSTFLARARLVIDDTDG